LTLSIVAGGCEGTIAVSQALVGGPTLAVVVCNSARRTTALVGADSVKTKCCGFTRVVLALINVYTLIDREYESWLTPTFGNMVGGGTCPSAAVDNSTCVNASIVGYLTNLVTGAVRSFLTLHFGATKRRAWISHMLLKASTKRFVVLNLTIRVWPALRIFTWVHAFSVCTSISDTG